MAAALASAARSAASPPYARSSADWCCASAADCSIAASARAAFAACIACGGTTAAGCGGAACCRTGAPRCWSFGHWPWRAAQGGVAVVVEPLRVGLAWPPTSLPTLLSTCTHARPRDAGSTGRTLDKSAPYDGLPALPKRHSRADWVAIEQGSTTRGPSELVWLTIDQARGSYNIVARPWLSPSLGSSP